MFVAQEKFLLINVIPKFPKVSVSKRYEKLGSLAMCREKPKTAIVINIFTSKLDMHCI